jgi:hypothetical protein
MTDVLLLVLVGAFFALCIAYVWWCDRIIGPDPPLRSPAGDDRSVAGAASLASEEAVPR